jgi:hypothetical protein
LLSRLLPLLLLLIGLRARAAQVDRWVSEGAGERSYHVVWEDKQGERIDTSFLLPVSAVERDRLADEGLSSSWRDAIGASAVKELSASLRAGERVESIAMGSGRGFRVRASTPERRATLLEEARAAADAATESAMKTLGRVRDPEGVYRIDLVGMIAEYAPLVEPVANALGKWSDSPEAFVARALGFVQTIPYESRRETFWGESISNDDEAQEERAYERVGYAAFRRPLALLDENLGDCDGKTVLFLAIVRARYPELPLAAVRIHGHVFGGVAVSGWDPGATFEAEGVTFTVVEPTGPAKRPPGSWPDKSRVAARTVFVLPP